IEKNLVIGGFRQDVRGEAAEGSRLNIGFPKGLAVTAQNLRGLLRGAARDRARAENVPRQGQRPVEKLVGGQVSLRIPLADQERDGGSAEVDDRGGLGEPAGGGINGGKGAHLLE